MKKQKETKPEQSNGLELKKKYKQVWTKIKNTTEIRQYHYDVYGDGFLIEPGESVKICTELKEIFVPVEEK